MAVYVTGDTHGDFSRFSPEAFPEGQSLTKEDFLLICGDFGGVWNGSPEEERALDALNALPFTTLFLAGNHENFDLLNTYPAEVWHGGRGRRIRPSVLYLLNGQIFDLCGQSFFIMGGASSRNLPILRADDRLLRPRAAWMRFRKQLFWVEHGNWWPDELPSAEEYAAARKNLAARNWSVDYVATHCAPTSIQNLLDLREAQKQGSYLPGPLTDFLDDISRRCQFQLWFLGHYHGNAVVNDRYLILYDQILRLTGPE